MANSYIHDGNPLHDARQFRNSLARVQELLETGANANYQYGGSTVLHSACIRGDLELATLLVDYGADIHARHPDHHRTPLLLACIDEDYLEARAPTDLIKMLVEKGADPNDEDHDFTALKYLITVKPFDTTILELMQFLINNGADVDIQGEFDRATALHWACQCKTPLEAVKLLIENGADIHVKDKYGRTPLHKACHFHNLEGAQLLVKHGADVLDQNYTGLMTPLHYACRLFERVERNEVIME